MEREEIRQAINDRPLTDYYLLEKGKGGANMYCCPLCGSGTKSKGTGSLHIRETGGKYKVKCFAGNCFGGETDTLGALRILWNADEVEVMKRCGFYAIGSGRSSGTVKAAKAQDTTPIYDFSDLYKMWHEALLKSEEGLNYLKGRSISPATAERFNLGYCAAWSHPKTPGAYISKRIIVPTSDGAYMARRIDDVKEYSKQKAGSGKVLFNVETLKTSDVVFICEGEFDAMSFVEAGAESVAIRSITNINEMLEAAKQHPKIVYFVALDNDTTNEDGSNPGAKAQMELVSMMEEAKLIVRPCNANILYCGEKDANEALVNHPEQFKRIINNSLLNAQKVKEDAEAAAAADLIKRTGPGMLDAFLQEVQTDKYKPIPTGISGLDRVLGGGLTRKTLVTLGAAPGAGKTNIAQWILENMAKNGTDVLFINMEMDRTQLIARSISRTAWRYNAAQDVKADLTTLQVLRGYNWTLEQRHTIEYAAAIYREKIAPHFVYNPDNVDNTLSSILGACKAEANRLQAEGKPAPIVCIDYLQLIEFDLMAKDEKKPDTAEALKRTMKALKDFACDYNTVVIVITAHNRASNKDGHVSMDSSRDTSNIEYFGDLMLGLTYAAIENDEKYIDGYKKDGTPNNKPIDVDFIEYKIKQARMKGEPRPDVANRLCLKVMKSRFSEPLEMVYFLFDGKHSNFTEIPTRDVQSGNQGPN